MVASLIGILALAPRTPVVAWLPPHTYGMETLPKDPVGYRYDLALEGYRVLRDPPADGSYRTPDPGAWERALKGQGVFWVSQGNAAPPQSIEPSGDALRRAAKAAKADYFAYVAIIGERAKVADPFTKVTIRGQLWVDRTLSDGHHGTFLFIGEHVTVRGLNASVAAKDLAGKLCVEAQRQIPGALASIAKNEAQQTSAPFTFGIRTPGPGGLDDEMKKLAEGAAKGGKKGSKGP